MITDASSYYSARACTSGLYLVSRSYFCGDGT